MDDITSLDAEVRRRIQKRKTKKHLSNRLANCVCCGANSWSNDRCSYCWAPHHGKNAKRLENTDE